MEVTFYFERCYYKIKIFLTHFRNSVFSQERRKWNTKLDNGTRSVSAASYAKLRLVPKVSYPENRKFTAPVATKRNSLLGVSSAIR